MWIQPRRAGQEVGKENAHTYRTCRESGHKDPPNGKQVSTGDMAEHRGVLWCIQIHTEAKALLVRQITRFPTEQMCIYRTQGPVLCKAHRPFCLSALCRTHRPFCLSVLSRTHRLFPLLCFTGDFFLLASQTHQLLVDHNTQPTP